MKKPSLATVRTALVGAALLLVGCVLPPGQTPLQVRAAVAATEPTVIAHRGGAANEGSLKAFTTAAQVGARLEFDIRWTRDNKMIIMHDATLDRTTNCTGAVTVWTYADLRAKCRIDGGHVIPFPMEVVTVARQFDVTVIPQIGPTSITTTQAAHVAGTFAYHPTWLQSSVAAQFAQMRTAGFTQRFALITWAATMPSASAVKATGAEAVAACYASVCTKPTAAQISAWKAAGLRVWLYTAYNDADHAAFRAAGAHAVITDQPVQAVNFYS